MGWVVDVFFCAFIGIVCAIIAHFVFGIPTNNLRVIFFLGFIGGVILDYLVNKIGSGSSTVPIICGCIFVIGIGYFFVLPTGSDGESDTKEIPGSISQSITDDSSSRLTKTTTITQIQYYTRSYHWTYGRHSPTYTIQIPKPLYEYYQQQPHDRIYAKYAISERDRKVLDRVILDFKENTDSKTEAAYNVVAFVQSLPYFKDDISTGYDEYPRYPIETLVDNGGDCEDTAILTAALLKEMNYDVILISPPGHMAVGITCSNCKGTSYTYNDKKYYYLETTGNNWKVGQMPAKYQNSKAKVYPI